MECSSVSSVLQWDDILTPILSFLKGADFLQARFVCRSWNDAALYNCRYKFLTAINRIQENHPSNPVSDARMFSSILMDRNPLAYPCKYFPKPCGSGCPITSRKVESWENIMSRVYGINIIMRDVTIVIRTSADMTAFVTVANNHRFRQLETLTLKVERHCVPDSGASYEFKPDCLEHVGKVHIEYTESFLNIKAFLEALFKTAKNTKVIHTEYLDLNLSNLMNLKELSVGCFEPKGCDMEKVAKLIPLLAGVHDRIESLALNFHSIESLPTLPVFPKLKKLKTCVINPAHLENCFPALRCLIASSPYSQTDRQMEKRKLLEMVSAYFDFSASGLRYLENNSFTMWYQEASVEEAFFESVNNSLTGDDRTLVLDIWIIDFLKRKSGARKQPIVDWNRVLNTSVQSLVVKTLGNSTLYAVVETLRSPEIEVQKNHRPGTSIEFVLGKVEDNLKHDDEFYEKFSLVMQTLAKRWGFIRIKQLKMNATHMDRLKTTIKSDKLPVELFSSVRQIRKKSDS